MNCNQIQANLVTWLRGELPHAQSQAFEAHCEICPDCAAARDEMLSVWNGLTDWPNESPSPNLQQRFEATLQAYESGLSAAAEHRSLLDRVDAALRHLWPARPAWQAALALGALLIGLLLGGQGRENGRLETLESQIGAMQEMVSLTLETAHSSSQRLEALSLAAHMPSPGDPVLQSLLTTLKEDPSTNVRLAAVDALVRFTNRPLVRETLAGTVKNQSSPLVQTALINLIAQSGQTEALSRLLNEADLDPAVRTHAQKRLDALI